MSVVPRAPADCLSKQIFENGVMNYTLIGARRRLVCGVVKSMAISAG